TLTIQGDTVKIRLVTDGAENGWGYSLSNVEAYRVEHVYETEGGDCIHCVKVETEEVPDGPEVTEPSEGPEDPQPEVTEPSEETGEEAVDGTDQTSFGEFE
ncbi:MAG: hypothetical protein IIV61_00680, partial [Oscillospiraceae bacterium]|nr:hypothetical protein [Oscillospiraceae bacterium]